MGLDREARGAPISPVIASSLAVACGLKIHPNSGPGFYGPSQIQRLQSNTTKGNRKASGVKFVPILVAEGYEASSMDLWRFRQFQQNEPRRPTWPEY
jgi:hypothetical protein